MLNNIQLLRALAALLVVSHHTLDTYLQMGGDSLIFERVGYFGAVGVDLFFVISGFVIALTISGSQQGLLPAIDYIKNRFFRIYLGYWPAFFVKMFLIYAIMIQVLDGMDVLKSFLLLPINPAAGKLPVMDVYWTLSFELYFYALCLIGFFVPRKFFNAMLLIYFLAIAWKNIKIPDAGHYTLINFSTSHFILEFIAGWFIFQCRNAIKNPWLLPLLLAGLIATIAEGVKLDARGGLERTYTFGTASVFLVAIALLLESNALYKANKWFVSVGNASYAIYLYHVTGLTAFSYWGFWSTFSKDQLAQPFAAAMIFIVLLCVACVIYYSTVERPLYKLACRITKVTSGTTRQANPPKTEAIPK